MRILALLLVLLLAGCGAHTAALVDLTTAVINTTLGALDGADE